MLKKFFVALAIALGIILVLCWIYLPSFSRYHELKQEEEKLNKRIQEIDTQIRSLTDEKYLLQNDVAYLEKVIREELGFVKPGEIIYKMITKKNAGETAPNAGLTANGTASVNATASTPPAKIQPLLQKQQAKTQIRAPSTKTTSSKRRPR